MTEFSGHRIGLAGPMLGGNDGWVTSQHEILAQRFADEGASIRTTSPKPGRVARLVDTLRSVDSWAHEVDVVLIAAFSGPAFWITDATSIVARHRDIPQILVLHGGDLPQYVREHPRRTRRCLDRADAIVAPSPYLATGVSAGRPVPVIPNVFDLDGIEFHQRTELSPRILWMRTFHPIYNPLLALDVLAQVQKRHPSAILTMAGQEKGLLGACKQRAIDLGLRDAVDFPGFLDEAQKRAAFAEHDIFLNTNDVDNAPVSVLEAAAAGLPIVATAVGGLPYLFDDGTNALLRPAGDTLALADAVLNLLDQPILAERLSQGGHRVAEQSAWNTVRELWKKQLSLVVATSC